MCCQHLTKTVNVSVVFLVITVLLTGCWDRLEIEQRTTVLGIAIDQATEEEAAQESSTTHVQGSFQAPDHKFIKLTLTVAVPGRLALGPGGDRKSTRLNSSHVAISYAVFCLKKQLMFFFLIYRDMI